MINNTKKSFTLCFGPTIKNEDPYWKYLSTLNREQLLKEQQRVVKEFQSVKGEIIQKVAKLIVEDNNE